MTLSMSTLRGGNFIQDPKTGLMQGAEPAGGDSAGSGDSGGSTEKGSDEHLDKLTETIGPDHADPAGAIVADSGHADPAAKEWTAQARGEWKDHIRDQAGEVKELQRDQKAEVKGLERDQKAEARDLERDQKGEAKDLASEQKAEAEAQAKEHAAAQKEHAADPEAGPDTHAELKAGHDQERHDLAQSHADSLRQQAEDHAAAKAQQADEHAVAVKDLHESHAADTAALLETQQAERVELIRQMADDFYSTFPEAAGAGGPERAKELPVGAETRSRRDLPPPLIETMGERRTHGGKPTVETRTDDKGNRSRRIVGHAAVFGQWATIWQDDLGEMRECIRPGAFKRAIDGGQDVRALFNHDSNFVLGRTRSGTLTLSEDKTGLHSVIDPPATRTVEDLVLTPIDRGDVDGMSFAFFATRSDTMTRTEKDGITTIDRGGDRITVRYDREKDYETIEREIIDADLFDVSPVTYPAYDGTDCALRGRSLPDVESLVKEVRSSVCRTVTSPAPKREEHRRKLDELAARLAGSAGGGSAVSGRKGSSK